MKTKLRYLIFGITFLSATAIVGVWQVISVPPVKADTEEQASVLKDLDIRQIPMAQIETERPASADQSLAVRTTFDRPDGKYSHGDELLLTVKVTEDAYIWVFDTGTSGKVHQIFPNRYEKDNFLKGGESVLIPDSDSQYEFIASYPKGAELITVIASKDSNPLTQSLIDQETGDGAFWALNGTANSVAKDLSITLKKEHPKWVGDYRIIHIE